MKQLHMIQLKCHSGHGQRKDNSPPPQVKILCGAQVMLMRHKLENYFFKSLQFLTFKSNICIYITSHVNQLANLSVFESSVQE